jgi:hypothetical protein
MKRRINRSRVGLQEPLFMGFLAFFLWVLITFSGYCHGSELLKELSESEFAVILGKYRQFSRIDVHFSQVKHIPDLGLKLLSDGKLIVIHPSTVIWQIHKPDLLKVVINTQEISMQSGLNEIERWPLDQVPEKMASDLKEMILWLKFDAQALYKHFTIYSKGDHDYSLIPRKNAAGSFTSMEMMLGSQGNVKRMKMVEKSGDFIDIQFDEAQFQNSR